MSASGNCMKLTGILALLLSIFLPLLSKAPGRGQSHQTKCRIISTNGEIKFLCSRTAEVSWLLKQQVDIAAWVLDSTG
ncbi:hypothetical protein Q9233_007994 [Columba guinea]|nr:hypothetical protein Q9233_007994 [Columba guinea]